MDISPIRSPCTLSWRADLLARTLSRLGRAWVMPSPASLWWQERPLPWRSCRSTARRWLANRTSRANTRTGSFGIACGDYRNASLDADYITWWQQAPGLVNEATLSHLHQELMAGRMRRGASALVLFDPSESEDASSFEQIRSANRNSRAVEWVELVEYDGVGVVLDAARPPQHLRRDHPNTPKRRK